MARNNMQFSDFYDCAGSRVSSGFSSLVDNAECENSITDCEPDLRTNTSKVSWNSNNKKTNARLEFELEAHKSYIKAMTIQNAKERDQFHKQIEMLEEKLEELQCQFQKSGHEYEEVLLELGRLDFEVRKAENERKHKSCFQQIFGTNECPVFTEPPAEIREAVASSEDENNSVNVEEENNFPVNTSASSDIATSQQLQAPLEDTETLAPLTVRNEHEHDHYQDLLQTIANSLLSSDFVNLANWASQKFLVDTSENATDVLFKLDEEGVISASDLSLLREFFNSIVRIDLVYRIDEFLLGNYSVLET